MEQTKCVNLPIIGRIQHGEKIQNKVVEHGYFIAKSDDTYMKSYLERFDKLFKGKQSIDIEFFSEDPLSIKYVRYNQSGEVCRCPEGSNKANQKVKSGWQQIECDTYNCQYRQKNEQGKCACNRIGWLKFLVPNVSTDRIFLMKITGQTSINKLNDYINLQKMQGKSIKGKYTLVLKQIEQSNSLGKTFNNYVLDILKSENFNSNSIPKETKKQEDLSTENTQKVDNKVENQTSNKVSETSTSKITENKDSKSQKKSSKITSSKKAKTDNIKENEEVTNNEDYFKNCYMLLRTFTEILTTKSGEQKEYLIAEVADMKDKISTVVIRPEDSKELIKCDLGTVLRLEINEIGSKKFAMKLEYIEKQVKELAA